MESAPDIASFVIRIIQDTSPESMLPYRGTIRHVQSDQEICFVELSDAVDFINGLMPSSEILPGNIGEQG